MNIGISAETASISPTPECASTATGTAAPGPAAAAFGQCMAQALKAQQQTTDDTEPHTADGLVAVVAEGAEQAPSDDDGESPPAGGDALAWLSPSWLPVGPGLPQMQQVSVGPNLLAITGASTTPDASSLQAFAQEQGLGAEAIAWLMNPSDAAKFTMTAATPMAAASSAAMLPPPASTWTDASALMPALASGPGNGVPGASAMAPTSDACAAGAAAVLAALGLTTPANAQASAPALSAEPAGGPTDAEGIATAAAVLGALRSVTPGNPGAKPTPAATSTATFNLSASSGWSESTLDLASLLGAEAEPQPDTSKDTDTAQGQEPLLGTALGTPSRAAHSTGPARADTLSPTGMGSEQLQQLSEKMADAIGERMLRELERGHWSMRLMLKPAHLGHIEVEMRLRGGELDATFAAPLAATRDLLQDGLTRLRDSLAQSGMDVANLHVKTGQNRQNGGDSTPGQQKFTDNNSVVKTAEAAPAAVESTPRPRRADGWDILV